MLTGLTEGRIVHYVLSHGDPVLTEAVGHTRAALIVRAWDKDGDTGCSNLLVFVDGSNDAVQDVIDIDHPNHPNARKTIPRFMFWATSRSYSIHGEPGTWHWLQDQVVEREIVSLKLEKPEVAQPEPEADQPESAAEAISAEQAIATAEGMPNGE